MVAVVGAEEEADRDADGEVQGTRGRYRARGIQVQKAVVHNLVQPKVVPLDRPGEVEEGVAVSDHRDRPAVFFFGDRTLCMRLLCART